ncbi:hypothetical protein CC78DRAFT_583509 [Lojkania enalia]|uniref:Uncharacterized protein n=1 Tax=Lojkania enalia TaxID=147567 RepID=A0A9P4N0P7_9PLEO|nr:hypothetical protein CC78DRAFT_583509 [Didymosphaeria enalia]
MAASSQSFSTVNHAKPTTYPKCNECGSTANNNLECTNSNCPYYGTTNCSYILNGTISDLSLEYCVALFNFPQCETAEAGICSLTYHTLVHHIANTVNGALESGVRANKSTSKVIYATATAHSIEKVAAGLPRGRSVVTVFDEHRRTSSLNMKIEGF